MQVTSALGGKILTRRNWYNIGVCKEPIKKRAAVKQQGRRKDATPDHITAAIQSSLLRVYKSNKYPGKSLQLITLKVVALPFFHAAEDDGAAYYLLYFR